MNELFNEMQSEGLITIEPTWIQKAIGQRNSNLTISLVWSKPLPLLQDSLGRALALILPNETSSINWN